MFSQQTSPMDSTAELSVAWQEWLHTNLARSCSIESIFDAMQRGQIDPTLAKHSIDQGLLARCATNVAYAKPKKFRLNLFFYQAY